MGWAARNNNKGNYTGFQCTKCFGTGIRGYKVEGPKRDKRLPIPCKCILTARVKAKEAEKETKEEDSPVSQLAEETGLEPAQ